MTRRCDSTRPRRWPIWTISDAAKPLAAAAREEPAFRVFAFTALSAMDDVAAYDELVDAVARAQRRDALRRLPRPVGHEQPRRAGPRREACAGQFSYHVVDSSGPPMIHVTRSYRPEIVLFGRNHPLAAPFVLEAGKQIMVTANGPEQVTVSKFAVNQPDQKRVVALQVDEVIRAIVELGGTLSGRGAGAAAGQGQGTRW